MSDRRSNEELVRAVEGWLPLKDCGCPDCQAINHSSRDALRELARRLEAAEEAADVSRGELVYRLMVAYLRAHGWQREEPGSAWWWRDDANDLLSAADAVDWCLNEDGIDIRQEP